MDLIVETVRSTCISLWAAVGFLLWIPFLARATAVYFTSLIATTFTGSDPGRFRAPLEFAMGFYRLGFANIINTFESREGNPGEQPNAEIQWWRFGVEVLWACIFWVSCFLLLAWIF